MNREEVLALFQTKAESLEKSHSRKQDIVFLLAEVIVHCSDRISNEDTDSLIRIGGTLVKHANTQSRARNEVAATMRNSRGASLRGEK